MQMYDVAVQVIFNKPPPLSKIWMPSLFHHSCVYQSVFIVFGSIGKIGRVKKSQKNLVPEKNLSVKNIWYRKSIGNGIVQHFETSFLQ